jgi:chromosome segregation ATPase
MASMTPAPTIGGNALPEITRRLQEERDALRQQVDDLSRRLHEERASRSAVEHERELKQLELLHLQQRSAQATQQLRDRAAQLERELESEAASHRMATMARSTAAQKSAALASEVKALEVRLKHEMEKKEVALAEVELLKDEVRAVVRDRDALVQRTEADAKRVRELWQQIAREHEVKLAAVTQELSAARHSSTSTDVSIVEYQKKVADLESVIQTLQSDNSDLKGKLQLTESDHDRFQQELQSERSKERETGERQHRLELEIQELKNRCTMLAQREEIAVRERELATSAAKKATAEADDRTQELLLLKTEFSELLDKHERLQEAYKHKARYKLQEAAMLAEKLTKEKRCAEELAAMRKHEITGYKKVIHAVECKLKGVEVTEETADAPTSRAVLREDGANPAKSSLCIYRH